MVAPTRAPQARGVKCDLCKRILLLATWLDQTKLARNTDDPQQVLNLIEKHNRAECPCIPKNIENLLVGSTHFELHRLLMSNVEFKMHKKQYEYLTLLKQKSNDKARKLSDNINDCRENNTSRFKVYSDLCEPKYLDRTNTHLEHLFRAIDFWKIAMEDLAHPFNAKLALRLGLTHHVIYACYLFKFHKILDYQLSTANLLLNLFKSIEGVTMNAQLHANYLFIRTLMDCGQYQSARHHLKSAIKFPNYNDKSHYESILLTCLACELSLHDDDDEVIHDPLDTLLTLSIIKPDDKLQHYYARTLAISTVIRYIHCYNAKSSLCFEYYHAFRYICAIIRRSFEDTFDLVLLEKNVKPSKTCQQVDGKQGTIMDHSWIKFAVSEFAFSAFDLLQNFYTRSGQPEGLELLYNGLILIAMRVGSGYWQARITSIGIELDILCSKYNQARDKLAVVSKIMANSRDQYLMKLIHLEREISQLDIELSEGLLEKYDSINDLFKKIDIYHTSLMDRITKIELYESKSATFFKVGNENNKDQRSLILEGCLGKLTYKILKLEARLVSVRGNIDRIEDIIVRISAHLDEPFKRNLEFYDAQTLLEIVLLAIGIHNSHLLLLEAVSSTSFFLKRANLDDLSEQLSSLTINEPRDSKHPPTTRPTKTKSRIPQLTIGRRSRRRGIYDVAARSEENLLVEDSIRMLDVVGMVKNFTTLTKEEILVSYLRNSEPNPDYLLYYRVHEFLFALRLKNDPVDRDQLLYHFCESVKSNSIRYRWMMYEEQQRSPYDPPNSFEDKNYLAPLGFLNSLASYRKDVRSFARSLHNKTSLLQIKYILDEKSEEKREHLLAVYMNDEGEPFYIHTDRRVTVDDIFAKPDQQTETSLVSKFYGEIEKSKKSLTTNLNQETRSQKRKQIETSVGTILNEIENELLGPFRFILSGRVLNLEYRNFVRSLMSDIITMMGNNTCLSMTALESILENAPLLSREEFCQLLGIIFDLPGNADQVRDCFNRWIKSIESHIKKYEPRLNKTTYMQTLTRAQLGLVLDKELELVPIESIPMARIINGGIFRVPSLRLYSVFVNRINRDQKIDINQTAYMLDPAGNLSKTRERFESKLKSHTSWTGSIGQSPELSSLEDWLASKDIYLFIGHGAGTTYYNQLCKGRGLSAMPEVRPTAIVMGCSSGRVLAEGPKLESFGINWVFILRGSPAYIGLLWDVTDTDIDRFLDSMLDKWLGSRWQGARITGKKENCLPITNAVAVARQVCQFKILVGSSSVVYGVPLPVQT